MLNFLKETRKLINLSEPIGIVLGNESCDLDSAVSSLALAYYYSQRNSTTLKGTAREVFLPLFNIPKRNFPLKTEVSYFLRQNAITADDLIFKDEVQESQISSSSIILVDHHVSPYATSCVEVYDHRPFDDTSQLPASCKKTIEQVGSCATLIGNLILLRETEDIGEFRFILRLLYGAIVMDTVNFSVDACRTTALDIQVAESIEKILGVENALEHREKIFRELCAAREDVSSLTAHQLLYKDMKMITNNAGNIKIALPGYPVSVQEYLKNSNAAEAVQTFAKEENCSVVLLIGMKITEGIVRRDIGLLNFNNLILFDEILKNLLESESPTLQLEAIDGCNFLEGRFFQQNNIKATRKHILAIVKRVLEEKL